MFSNDKLVIIEAKAYQGLSNKQNEEFKKDVKQIEELFEYLKKNGITNEMPKVKLIILASSGYFGSKSFKSENGIEKRFINDKDNKDYLFGIISWKQISDQLFPCDPIFKRADDIYIEKEPIKNKKLNSERFARNPVFLARPQTIVLNQILRHVSSSEFSANKKSSDA